MAVRYCLAGQQIEQLTRHCFPLGAHSGANRFQILPDEVDFISIDDQSDTDVFSFTIGELGFVDIVLDTLGETYQIAGQVTGGITDQQQKT